MEQITSVQNPKIKELLALQEKSRLRREKGVFVVEGRRELEHCINAGYKLRTVFICPEIAGVTDSVRMSVGIIPTDPFIISLSLAGGSIIEVSRAVYDKVAYRGGTEGVIAEVYSKENSLESLELGENPLVIVLEGVEKPGNLGAVLRSADAAGVDAVLICDPLTDIYNPNLIRASIGAVFTQQVACCTNSDAIGFLKRKGIRIYTAQLQDSEWYYDTDMRCGTAIAIGTEATGLTDQWREAADAHIKIPMLGRLDSLNASVSAAILLYEAVRQRNSNR